MNMPKVVTEPREFDPELLDYRKRDLMQASLDFRLKLQRQRIPQIIARELLKGIKRKFGLKRHGSWPLCADAVSSRVVQ